MELGLVIWLGTYLIASVVAALFWQTHQYLRPLPIIFGVCAGFVVSIVLDGDREVIKIFEKVIISGGIGLVLFLAIWVEARRPSKRKKES